VVDTWAFFAYYLFWPLAVFLLASVVLLFAWFLNSLRYSRVPDPHAAKYRFQFSLRSLMLFIIGLAGSTALLVLGTTYQPFGVLALGSVFVVALLGEGQNGR
jgi:hypothetical protein